MLQNKFERCEPDDPNRCQASGKQGQCPYKAEQKVDGTYFSHCIRHNASRRREDENKRMRNFRLGLFQQRMEEFADNDQVKSLREEIGITRLLLEEIIRTCQDSTQLVMASNKIADLVLKIEKLVTSCHRLEKSSGMLLDKATIQRLADSIINIISGHVEPEVTSQIAMAIMQEIIGSENEE
jgi:hypothetical protein